MNSEEPNAEVVPAGGGPGEEFAKLGKHVLPVALYLGILTLILLGLLIYNWPHCELDGCNSSIARTAHATRTGTKQGEAPGTPATPAATPAGTPAGTPIEISALEPTSGTICGGDEVTITGSGFSQGPAEVRFGGFATRSVMPRGGSSLVVETPAHWEGATDVTVKIKNNVSTVTKAFNYVCPQRTQNHLLLLVVLAGTLGGTLHALRSLISFTGARNLRISWLCMYYLLPFSGAAIGTIFFLVFVAGFFSPQGASGQSFFLMVGVAALVGMFGQQSAEKLKKISEAILTSVPPAPDKSPPALTLTEVKPSEGSTAGGTKVVLTGTGFASGATVTFGGAAATDIKVTATRIDATTPAHPAGKVDVEVCNPDNKKAKKTGAFEYKEPTLAEVKPSEGSTAGGTAVVLTGTGFAPGATVTFGGTAATDINVTATRIDATAPAHPAGKVDVEVCNPDNKKAKKTEAFEYK